MAVYQVEKGKVTWGAKPLVNGFANHGQQEE